MIFNVWIKPKLFKKKVMVKFLHILVKSLVAIRLCQIKIKPWKPIWNLIFCGIPNSKRFFVRNNSQVRSFQHCNKWLYSKLVNRVALLWYFFWAARICEIFERSCFLKQSKKVGMNYQINDTHVMVWFH